MTDFERRLRASLRNHARHAPDGKALAEQILAAADRPGAAPTPLRRAAQWRTWTFPLIAAAAVAAVALALVTLNQGSSGHPVAQHTGSRPTTTQPATTPPNSASSSAPTTGPTPGPTPTRMVTVLSHNTTRLLTGVKVLDLSFVGHDDGWALATADCLDAPPATPAPTCTAMLRTSNGGASWHGMPTPPANVPIGDSCAAPCVQHVRFATDEIGYAFGPSALFMTTDGGASWTRPSGGADALETLDGNVIRASTACLPGCPYRVQIAPIGSTAWHAVTLPGEQADMNSGVTLTRTGSRAFIEIYGHTAGGAGRATSVLFTSTDDGATWARRGEPCPQIGDGPAGNEVDSTQLTSAADGSVTVLCTPRAGGSSQFTATSTDGGVTFRHGPAKSLGAAPVSVLGAASATVLFVSSDDTYRSADGGRTWRRAHSAGGTGPGQLSWFGFESRRDARAVTSNGTTVWTTHDAGRSWVPYAFG